MVSENFGESELAERFGVARYPAVFVDEVLVAKPKDFGFFGTNGSQGAGRYTPWLRDESQEMFRKDMQRAIGRALRGEEVAAAEDDAIGPELTRMPDFELEDIDGVELRSEALLGSVTVVEFWATWCPPCIKALPHLRDLQAEFAGDMTLISVAVESREEDVRRVVAKHQLPFPTVLGTPELAVAFGDLVAVPTTFVFGPDGRLAKTTFGAPPTLLEDLRTTIEGLIEKGDER